MGSKLKKSILHTTELPCSFDLNELPCTQAPRTPTTSLPPPSSPPLSMWSRRDDKLLELLFILYFPGWDIIAYNLVGNKTPEEAFRRYESLLDEVTRVLQGLEVDAQQIAVAASSRTL
jgi:hypothetical protein